MWRYLFFWSPVLVLGCLKFMGVYNAYTIRRQLRSDSRKMLEQAAQAFEKSQEAVAGLKKVCAQLKTMVENDAVSSVEEHERMRELLAKSCFELGDVCGHLSTASKTLAHSIEAIRNM